MSRRTYVLLIIALLPLLLTPAIVRGQADPDARVDADVRSELAARGAADVLIFLDPRPDLAPARRIMDKSQRGQWVYDTLRAAAREGQAPIKAELRRMGLDYRSYWIANAVWVRVTPFQLDRLLRTPNVRSVALDKPYRVIDPFPAEPFSIQEATGIEWGVNRVNAPWAWDQGVTGSGVVVAGQDTGYQWDHPALVRAYRGFDPNDANNPDHDYNWHDSIHHDISGNGANPCGFDSPEPCDDHGHGTHTMGAIAGNDMDPADPAWPEGATNAIGIAPGAKWVSCRNMEEGVGRPSTYIECFEWFTAPWPIGGDPDTDGDPSKAPDVINNSWGCPPSEECDGPEIEPAMNAAIDAGIVVVVSAGNAGSSCSSVNDPPAIYPRSFAVAATNSSDNLASFSSRGPVTYNGDTYRKPDISGPGVSVRSAYPTNSYATMSGTSMAGPHVAGVTALLLSAEPSLKGRVEMTQQILMRTADPKTSSQGCGGDGVGDVPNNGFGWGIVNARSAIESLSVQGTLTGVITDTITGATVANATVALHPLGDPATTVMTATTSAAGAYAFTADWGEYEISISKGGYADGQAAPIYVVGGKATTQDAGIDPIPAAVSDLRISISGMDVLLQWGHQDSSIVRYEVWRAIDTPYFTPDASGIKIGEVTPGHIGDELSFTDTSSPLRDASQQGYYLALPVNSAGQRAKPEPRKGEFDFALIPGVN
jgi:subtilisin family serine protease